MSSLLMFLIASATCLQALDATLHNGTEILPEKEGFVQACHNKIVGTHGSISSPVLSGTNYTCRWDVDVTKNRVAVIEFQNLRMPENEEGSCDSYIQISYGPREHQIKQKFCSASHLENIYTDSQQVVIKAVYHSACQKECSGEFAFKIHYSGVTISKSVIENHILLIVLCTMSGMLLLALCAILFRCRTERQRAISAAPDPVRQPLQDLVEFQRRVIPVQEPRKLSFSIFQSGANTSNLRRWTPNSHLERNNVIPQPQDSERQRISIATTPRSSFFPSLSRKWSDTSVKRIQHLRTRLVSRFSSSSSHNTSDISVYFSSEPSYSQLRSEEDRHDHENASDRSRSASTSRKIPSIVIEMVD